MKVLTLHQPWASLVALGVKSIETRSWPTQYRGPLAIHAAAKVPAGMSGPAGMIGRFTVHQDARSDGWYMLDSQWEGRELGAYQYPIPVPLGAIVATCTLVDVVPMVDGACGPGHAVLQVHPDCLLGDDPFGDPRISRDFTGQRPYGDFTPGRFAWLLADVVPVDPPVPFKGGQGLTRTWEPVRA